MNTDSIGPILWLAEISAEAARRHGDDGAGAKAFVDQQLASLPAAERRALDDAVRTMLSGTGFVHSQAKQ